ncbi:TAXI family TRAP transporter solute-binding subunit [Geoalkalibacter subterraneus]|uniref:TAXI family TRAP transporter solute-binding subunit n=1 Tax=Geoalkalibacter subterraneus TaxID=483547 RepID=UPI00069464E4|nr:TAXI family TRAP transporter solute-binding subunit [Geoalkalibacter subterraneus]
MSIAFSHPLLRIAVLVGIIFAGTTVSAVQWGPQRLTFVGGPAGGTFEQVAKKAVAHINDHQTEATLNYSLTGGSVENLRRINKGQADMGIVYAADLFLGREGRLPFDERTYDNVYTLASFYLAPAQLIVKPDSQIEGINDLIGKRVAVGSIGSGTAATAQRFLTALDIWDQIKPEFIGYQDAISALGHGYVDAMWVLAGIPNSAVTQAAESYPIRILDLSEAAEKSGFFKNYPFYSLFTVPAGTYPGVESTIATFADQALWVAGKSVDPELVKGIMKALEEGGTDAEHPLKFENPPPPSIAPMHDGAEAFWRSLNSP